MTYVTTTDPKRRAAWVKIFHLDRLPVKQPRPRLQSLPLLGDVLAYDLDPSRVNRFAISRLAHNRSAIRGINYETAYSEIMRDGWPIPAEGVTLAEGEGGPRLPSISHSQHGAAMTADLTSKINRYSYGQ